MRSVVVALDFDGVICDSLDECMVSAYNAYCRFSGVGTWASTPAEIPFHLAARFRRVRHLVRPAGEYWILMEWLHTRLDDLRSEDFRRVQQAKQETLRAFELVFFTVRKELRERNAELWSSWHRLYAEFEAGWNGLRKRVPVYVVSTKDFESVAYFNNRWRLGIPRDRLWTKERHRNKPDAITSLARRERIQPSGIVFVDDHPDHLRDAGAVGAECFLAGWGYASQAHAAGCEFPCLADLTELSSQLDAWELAAGSEKHSR